ncbi:MAG TPA: BON domain-containing protein [Candidatus Eisenbacteria bacterium]
MARAQRRNNDSDTFNSYRDDSDRERRDWSSDWDRDNRREDRDREFYRFEDLGRGTDDDWFDRDRERGGNRDRQSGNRESRNFGRTSDWRSEREYDRGEFGNYGGEFGNYDRDNRDLESGWQGGRDQNRRGNQWSSRTRENRGYQGEGFDDRGDYSPMNRYGQDFGRQSFEGFGQSRNRQFQNQGQYGQSGQGQYGQSGQGQYGQSGSSGQYGQSGQGQYGQHGNQGSRFGQPMSGEYGSSQGSMDRSHAGVGPKNYKRSDERIKEDLCEMFSANPWLDASNTEVEVKQGVVTLTGTVGDRRMRQMMEDIADGVPGVKDVECQIKLETKTKAGAMGTGEKSGEKDKEKGGNSGSSTHDAGKNRQ